MQKQSSFDPTANGTAVDRTRLQPQIADIRPKVAMNSQKICAALERTCDSSRQNNVQCQ
jgi:hypothetical protein